MKKKDMEKFEQLKNFNIIIFEITHFTDPLPRYTNKNFYEEQ